MRSRITRATGVLLVVIVAGCVSDREGGAVPPVYDPAVATPSEEFCSAFGALIADVPGRGTDFPGSDEHVRMLLGLADLAPGPVAEDIGVFSKYAADHFDGTVASQEPRQWPSEVNAANRRFVFYAESNCAGATATVTPEPANQVPTSAEAAVTSSPTTVTGGAGEDNSCVSLAVAVPSRIEYRVTGSVSGSGGQSAVDEREVVSTTVDGDRVDIVTTVGDEQRAVRSLRRVKDHYDVTFYLDAIGGEHLEVIPDSGAVWFPGCVEIGLDWSWEAQNTNERAILQVERSVVAIDSTAGTVTIGRRTTFDTTSGSTHVVEEAEEVREIATGAIVSESVEGSGVYAGTDFEYSLERSRA